MAVLYEIGRFARPFVRGYLMGVAVTIIFVMLCVLGVLLQFLPDVHLFSGWTMFHVATLGAKRVHLDVRTPILLPPLLVALLSCLSVWRSQRRVR